MNDVLHGKLFTHPNLLLQKANLEFSNFIQAQDSLSIPPPSCLNESHSAQTWKKPPAGSVKVNWDDACNRKQRPKGLGAIMRDHEGHVMRTLCVKKSIASFSNLILKGDALQVVKMLPSNSTNWSEGGCLINDLRYLFSSFTN